MIVKTAVTVAGSAAALWVVSAFLLWRWQENLLFFPRPTPPAAEKALADMDVEVTAADGAILRGWAHPGNLDAPKTSCKLLLYFGGNSEELSANVLADGPRFSCPQWYVNYRGFGASDGEPSAELLRSDALQIADEAARQFGIGAGDICVFGRSLGSHMAAHVAARRGARKLVMVTPFDSVLNVARSRYAIFPVSKLLRHRFDTLAEAPDVSTPTLFLLAESDRIVPRARSANLIANWRAPHFSQVLPGTSHNFIETPEYWQAIAEFLAEDQPARAEDGDA